MPQHGAVVGKFDQIKFYITVPLLFVVVVVMALFNNMQSPLVGTYEESQFVVILISYGLNFAPNFLFSADTTIFYEKVFSMQIRKISKSNSIDWFYAKKTLNCVEKKFQ